MATAQKRDLWGLAIGPPEVDPGDLAGAIEDQAREAPLDFRTRLLIRDSVEALRQYWGGTRAANWLARSPVRDRIESILREDLGEPGFSLLARRLVQKTDPNTVRQFLQELGATLPRTVPLYIGGSVALILPGYLSRQTEDINVVDEVPSEIRAQHAVLDDLKQRFGLLLAHFQSHYLPKGWQQRIHSLESFGSLQVYLVDVYDVFLSKLFSGRTKDRDDLRMLIPQLDKDTIVRRFRETTQDLTSAPDLREKAEKNWYILYGEPLPS
jgi:hypothetical protein